MVDLVTAISTASQALKMLNELRGVDKAFDAASLRLKIAELSGAVSDLKLALIDAKEEIAEKQKEIERLEGLMKRHAELIEAGGYKYDKTEKGRATGHAYCPVCEQAGTLVHVTTLLDEHQQCPKCKALYTARVFP
jgi:rubrerythrin